MTSKEMIELIISNEPTITTKRIIEELEQRFSVKLSKRRVQEVRKAYFESLEKESFEPFGLPLSNIMLEDSYFSIKEGMIKDMQNHAPKYKDIKQFKPNKNGNLLILDPADVHIGKLAVACEVGEDYNVEKAIDNTIEGCLAILQEASPYNIQEIALIIGNDILHIDTINRTTTSGTPQDTDGMWHENFIAARKLYVELIEILAKTAKVRVIFNSSNHDRMSGFFLADSVRSWFHNHKNVSFDTSISPRKYFMFGNNMIMTAHGDDGKASDYPLLMALEEKEMWAKSDHRYIYLHHVHHKKQTSYKSGQEYNGVMVEYVRSPSVADSWHHRNGYTARRAVEGFIHSPTKGQINRITHYFD